MTVLLARNRQPPPTVAAGVPHAELAAKLISLPSGLLAMVCEAIVKLKVRWGVRLGCLCGRAFRLHGRLWPCVRVCVFASVGPRRGPTRSRCACQSGVGAARASRGGPAACGVEEGIRVATYSSGRCGPVSDGTSAAGDGAPPWHGATRTARMRSAVPEIRRQKCPIQPSTRHHQHVDSSSRVPHRLRRAAGAGMARRVRRCAPDPIPEIARLS